MTEKEHRPLSAGAGKKVLRQADYISINSKLLVVVDRQEFVRGCLSSWIGTFGQEFDLASVADVTASLPAATLAGATVVILSANALMLADGWLDGQVAWLRANLPNVPIVAIIKPDETQSGWESVRRLRLQGYIPTSSSMEVAAAVLRLVAAGGTYIPHCLDEDRPPPLPLGGIHQTADAAAVVRLTPRERGVLELLERGMANKMIACHLGLSQSTVKAHVHNIMSKLKVRNRTAAVMAGKHLQPAMPAKASPE